jgi:hypothetical protein
MTQDDIDVFAVRGFLGIVNLLEDRIRENNNGLCNTALIELTETEIRFRKIVKEIMKRRTVTLSEEASMDRLDRWFSHGFANLLGYLESRLKQGPPMKEVDQARIQIALIRACRLGLNNERFESSSEVASRGCEDDATSSC